MQETHCLFTTRLHHTGLTLGDISSKVSTKTSQPYWCLSTELHHTGVPLAFMGAPLSPGIARGRVSGVSKVWRHASCVVPGDPSKLITPHLSTVIPQALWVAPLGPREIEKPPPHHHPNPNLDKSLARVCPHTVCGVVVCQQHVACRKKGSI